MRDAALNPKPKYFQTTVDTVLDTEAYASLPFNAHVVLLRYVTKIIIWFPQKQIINR